MSELLKSLNINENNFGACYGPEGWINKKNDKIIKSFNPSNGQEIASVYEASVEDYKVIITKSLEAFNEWRKVPAPERGQMIRKMSNALRDYKDQLGSLVSLEMGKIKQEGDGEVQERASVARLLQSESFSSRIRCFTVVSLYSISSRTTKALFC